MNIAFLGLGAMGSRMALNLLNAGHRLTVWNRSSDKSEAIVGEGARRADSPKDAAKDADYVISMVRDDDAAKAVWLDPATGALASMQAGACAIECSTLSVATIEHLQGRCRDLSIDFIDAPVAGSLPQAKGRQLVFLVGANEALFARVEPVLKAMGSTCCQVGDTGAGSKVKLAVNALLCTQVASLAELLGDLKNTGIALDAAFSAISSTAVCSPALAGAGAGMLNRQFSPLFPIDLVVKDARYLLASTDNPNSLPLASTVFNVFKQALDKGYGDENINAVLKIYP